MARPLRIEYSGALYHVVSRGDRRESVFGDAADRALFLDILGQALLRFDARALAYCLMDDHYHLVLTTREANLSRLMRQVNGVYTQAFNRRHGLSGHLFQGRFKAILVDQDAYLLELCRFVDLTPVRARMVRRPEAHAWSSYRALAGLAGRPEWLDAKPLYDQLAPGKRATRAAADYAAFVAQGKGVAPWEPQLRQQIYLGGEAFVRRTQQLAGINQAGKKRGVSRAHTRVPARPSDLRHYAALKAASKEERNQSIANAFYQGGHTLTAIARAFGVSISTVSRVVAAYERGAG